MYLDFFKLNKNPFHITPDPEFLFLSTGHKEAFAAISYGIEGRKGFIAVTGEVGVGKTTVLRTNLQRLDPQKTKIIYVFNTCVSFHQLLQQIFFEVGIPFRNEEAHELVSKLAAHVAKEYWSGQNVVFIIDEAQNMPIETLEQLRMLSNLETTEAKMLQVVMVGQPEFETKLNLPELRQLKQRIAVRALIKPLSREEATAYIIHRLMKASTFYTPIFTDEAMRMIIEESKGIPRTINILCDNSLVTAFGYQRNPVDVQIVEEVIADISGKSKKKVSGWRKWLTLLRSILPFSPVKNSAGL